MDPAFFDILGGSALLLVITVATDSLGSLTQSLKRRILSYIYVASAWSWCAIQMSGYLEWILWCVVLGCAVAAAHQEKLLMDLTRGKLDEEYIWRLEFARSSLRDMQAVFDSRP